MQHRRTTSEIIKGQREQQATQRRRNGNQTQSQHPNILDLSSRIYTDHSHHYSISEEPEYNEDYQAKTTRANNSSSQLNSFFMSESKTPRQLGQTNLNNSFSHQYPQILNYNSSALQDLEQFQQEGALNNSNIQDETSQYRNRRHSFVTQTNLAMCRPNQLQQVDSSNTSMAQLNFGTDGYQWEKIDSLRFNNSVPSSRNSCSWVEYGDILFIFGGFTFNGRLDDIHEFNFENYNWSKVSTTGIKPTPRENNGAILYKDHMYIFGGYDGQSWLNDFYSLNLKTLKWNKIDQKGSEQIIVY